MIHWNKLCTNPDWVTEKDLPKIGKTVLISLKQNKKIITDAAYWRYDNHIIQWYSTTENDYPLSNVIAWADLPDYEE